MRARDVDEDTTFGAPVYRAESCIKRKQLTKLYEFYSLHAEEILAVGDRMETVGNTFLRSDAGAAWKKMRFGIRKQCYGGIPGKTYLQLCRHVFDPFSELVLERLPGEATLEFFHTLRECFVDALAAFEAIDSLFFGGRVFAGYARNAVLDMIALRLIKYHERCQRTLRAHFDTTVLSSIYPSTDAGDHESLHICADSTGTGGRMSYQPVRGVSQDGGKVCSVVLPGVFSPFLAPLAAPVPHVVLPFHTDARIALVAELHAPRTLQERYSKMLNPTRLERIPRELLRRAP